MGKEVTWFHLLPGLHRLTEWAKHYLGREKGDKLEFLTVPPFTDTHFTLIHVLSVVLILVLLTLAAIRFRIGLSKKSTDAIVPSPSVSIGNLFELISEGILGFMTNIMGEKNAKKYLPIIGTLAFFILLSNLMALVPGMDPPTAALKTNLALALSVFILTHYEGVKAQGAKNYLKHFTGPIVYLAPLFIVIEIIGHLARPVSLSIRLMGNMFSDHKIGAVFFGLVPLLIPVPFLVLGLIVAIVQTFVFCLLATVYIQLAISHEGHGDEDHAGQNHHHNEKHP